VKTHPFTHLMLALALILAPLGLCLNHAMAAAAPVNASGMHHGAPQAAADHSGHGDVGNAHFCAECRSDSFVKAAKSAVPDIAPASAAAPLPAAPSDTFAPQTFAQTFARGLSPPPSEPFRKYRIRLQI
jgi:hypothetical protein